jgi:hypothetical protein
MSKVLPSTVPKKVSDDAGFEPLKEICEPEIVYAAGS